MAGKSFPNNKQVVGSSTCGPTSLVNIYQHYGKKVPLQDILRDLKVSTKKATYICQLGNHLIHSKLQVVLVTSNTFTAAADWKNASKKIVLNGLKQWLPLHKKNKYYKNVSYIISFLEDGGEIDVTDLTTHLLDSYLDKGYILLVLLEDSWLWGKRKIKNKAEYNPIHGLNKGHFVVVFDKSEQSYVVSDPYPTSLEGREGVYTISKDTLLVSCLIWGGEVLAVKK